MILCWNRGWARVVIPSMRRALFITALLALPACSETVAFLPLELVAPEWDPAISCADDPRRVKVVVIRAECAGATVEERFSSSAGAVSLNELPLGECLITVTGLNLYGRAVASGSASAIIAVGENPSVKITLLEDKCKGSCDTDEDGLADVEEKKHGTSSATADSDGDGLLDGLELVTCCSDPTKPDAKNCQLAIYDVTPPLGPPGEWVLTKTTKPVTGPKVFLGGKPLANPLADSSTIFGRVGAGAVLGDVVLTTSTNEKDTYKDLFAVLHKDPEMWFDLDQKAGAKVGIMQEAVDLAHEGSLLIALGRSSPLGTAKIPVLLFVNRATGQQTRLPIKTDAVPVAVDLVTGRLGVLVRPTATTAMVMGYELDAKTGKITGGTSKVIGAPVAVDLALEPSGQAALVLSRALLTRVTFSSTGKASAVSVSVDPNNLKLGALPSVATTCTGMAYHEPAGTSPGEGTVFLACSGFKQPCAVGQTCPGKASLLALKPAASCLNKGASGGLPAMAGCWTYYSTSQAQVSVGAPYLDTLKSAVFMLTNRGVFSGGFPGKVAKVGLRPLVPLFQFPRQGQQAGLRVMSMDTQRRLYVADGASVRRLDLTGTAGAKIPNMSFRIGWAKEEAANLSVSGDGSMLEISRQRSGALHSLAGVCLRRCPTCLCK